MLPEQTLMNIFSLFRNYMLYHRASLDEALGQCGINKHNLDINLACMSVCLFVSNKRQNG